MIFLVYFSVLQSPYQPDDNHNIHGLHISPSNSQIGLNPQVNNKKKKTEEMKNMSDNFNKFTRECD